MKPDPFRVMIVEDDETLGEMLVEELEAEGYRARNWLSAESALEAIDSFDPDLVVSDLQLPGADGFDVLDAVRKRELPPALLMITAYGTIDRAVAALKAGADHFLTKPLDMEHFVLSVQRILSVRRLQDELLRFRRSVSSDSFHGMEGASREMNVLFERIVRIAKTEGTVLVRGESGTGKELVARALHKESNRASGPFLAVNCAGIPEGLLESEFFGHTAGAFSGASGERSGLFREASGGTLFLDEIGDMPESLQAKLLRALEDGHVRPVGAEREHRVDVRLIAATNMDLLEAVENRRFRDDLYYRLEGFQLEIPPLRERGDDLDLLTAKFVERYAAARQRPAMQVSGPAIRAIRNYPWPGNVRELKNAVERAVTFCEGETIKPEHLPERVRNPQGERNRIDSEPFTALTGDDALLPSLDEIRKRYVRHVLERVGGNKRRAAAVLGVGRRTLYRWLDQHAETRGK